MDKSLITALARLERAGSLQFAKDVAEGLLDEIAARLEERAAQADTAAVMLESHTQ